MSHDAAPCSSIRLAEDVCACPHQRCGGEAVKDSFGLGGSSRRRSCQVHDSPYFWRDGLGWLPPQKLSEVSVPARSEDRWKTNHDKVGALAKAFRPSVLPEFRAEVSKRAAMLHASCLHGLMGSSSPPVPTRRPSQSLILPIPHRGYSPRRTEDRSLHSSLRALESGRGCDQAVTRGVSTFGQDARIEVVPCQCASELRVGKQGKVLRELSNAHHSRRHRRATLTVFLENLSPQRDTEHRSSVHVHFAGG
ncbi:hypothetical protein V8E36_005910 [Tilletia maclaganii]